MANGNISKAARAKPLALRLVRKAALFSQEHLAGRVGSSQPEISRIENGTRRATPAQQVAIARALGTSVAALFEVER